MNDLRERYEVLNDMIEDIDSLIRDLEKRFDKKYTKDVVESLDATVCEFLNEKEMLEERIAQEEKAEKEEEIEQDNRTRI